MNKNRPKGPVDAFISHAWEDKPLAVRLEESLEAAGIRVWIDHANLRAGSVLIDALQAALENAANLVLLWSKWAAESRYVSAEWQAAFELEKGLVPCRLDETPLPPFVRRLLFCDFRESYDAGRDELVKTLQSAPAALPKPGRAARRKPARNRAEMVETICTAQNQVLACLQDGRPDLAGEIQARADPLVERAVGAYPEDALILSVAGYHKKNAYMIRHWGAIQARQAPRDPLLDEAEQFFFAALSAHPSDVSAMNGLGSILLLKRDLDAAEFYVRRALARAKEEQIPYGAAEHDLKLVQWLKRERRGG